MSCRVIAYPFSALYYLVRVLTATVVIESRPSLAALTLMAVALTAVVGAQTPVPPRLADASDRAAFRTWFTFLAELQFEQPAAEVGDCAALVRFAFREALRPHTPDWLRRVALSSAPRVADVRTGPRPGPRGWPLFLVDRATAGFGEFADARTLVTLNARPVGRDARRAQPGDLLYYRQPGQGQPDHLMVFVGRSAFDGEGSDWVVYHTGADAHGPGEVRKVRLADLERHPSPRWRPVRANERFVGLFRLALL
jgi:uncharacterized protein YfaT (DUF1175 family)